MPLYLGGAGGTKFSSERTAFHETGSRTLVLWNLISVVFVGQAPRKKKSSRLAKHELYLVGVQEIIRDKGESAVDLMAA
jgi:hypothetical protein